MDICDFAVSTNHPFNRYKSGQTVKGKVHFNLDQAKTIRGVYVKIKGIAKVSWRETGYRHKKRKRTKKYYGKQEYFNERIYFIGEEDGESFELPPGDYNYKFDYDLPVGLPTSYEGTYGGVHYTIKAVVDIPWELDDEEEIDLEVTSSIDLNTKPDLKNPFHIRKMKHLCCLWCKTGPIIVEVDILKTGYIHGESIPIGINIENSSDSKINSIDCTLGKTITFYSEQPSHHMKESTEIVCQKKLHGVEARNTKIYDEKLEIPEGIVLNFDNCTLLDVQYDLKIEVNINGFHMNLSTEIPIMMGSIPIRKDEPSAPPVSILAGLGTPYPYEHHQSGDYQPETTTVHNFNTYNWTTSVKAVI